MIAIVNIGPAPGNKRRGVLKNQPRDVLGPHCYEVRINHAVQATFTHARGDSLAACLRKAAEAVEQAHLRKLNHSIQEIQAYAHDRPQAAQ
jgi:hypothetical protein